MSSDWEWVRLGDHCSKIGSGATPTGGKDSYLISGPFCLIRSQNIYNDGFTPSGLAFISNEQAKKLDGVAVQENDVLLNITGDSVARVCLAEAKYLPARVNQHVAIIRPTPEKLNSRFLRYFLASPFQQDVMLGLAGAGATRNALTKVMIEDFKVPCPPIIVQSRIAEILGSLDDRIALLRETNATVEAIAQALFKSWFVDFDPVHANAGTQAPSLPLEILALFPTTFTDSPQGPIPAGWKVKQLGDVTAYLNRGISPKYVETGGVFVINQKCIRDFAVDLSKARRHDPIQRKIDGRILEVGDILVNSTGVGTLGRVAQLLEVTETMIIDSHVTAVRTNSELSWPYLGLALMRKQPEIEAMGEGTTGQTELARAKLAMLPIVCPPEEVLKVFDDIVTPLKKTLAANATKAENLSTLRDTLLPRLISGQLRLAEAEQTIAAITD
jgi:type I restriction enzyme S subunit